MIEKSPNWPLDRIMFTRGLIVNGVNGVRKSGYSENFQNLVINRLTPIGPSRISPAHSTDVTRRDRLLAPGGSVVSGAVL